MNKRVASIDILRGFDMFLLVFLQPVIYYFGKAIDCQWILYNFSHETWEGFRFWDIIMPLFMFMAGTSLPFSMAKYQGQESKWPAYKKILRRFVILFALGWWAQGNILGLDINKFYIYNNTLQAIASGYLIASIILLNTNLKGRIAAIAALLLIYWIPMRFCGDYTNGGSFANKVDALLMGRFQGDASYTWIWSSLTFAVTVLLGSLAGTIIKEAGDKRPRAALQILVLGALCLGLGLLWSLESPIIKRLWTTSMTLFSGGICLILMAAFYWWIDVRGHIKGLDWLKIYGMNSIAAYIIGLKINFRSVAQSLLYGFEHLMKPEFYTVLITFANYAIVFCILLILYRKKIFIKV